MAKSRAQFLMNCKTCRLRMPGIKNEHLMSNQRNISPNDRPSKKRRRYQFIANFIGSQFDGHINCQNSLANMRINCAYKILIVLLKIRNSKNTQMANRSKEKTAAKSGRETNLFGCPNSTEFIRRSSFNFVYLFARLSFSFLCVFERVSHYKSVELFALATFATAL